MGGAAEPDMTVRCSSLATAFAEGDLVDVAKHLAAGADVNTRLFSGQGVQATNHGGPLHACCAMPRTPGAFEVAQILVRRKADLTLGDVEGDSPLAHARFFRAQALYELFEGHGASDSGPFYRMFGRR